MTTNEDFKYTSTLSPETHCIAKEELKEDESTRHLELKAFRDRLLEYPGLKARTDPQFLIRFLRARKFDQERAFQLVLNHYAMIRDFPEIFDGLKPSCVSHVYDCKISFPYPHKDKQGRQIYMYYPARVDTDRLDLDDCVKAEWLNLSKIMEEEENQVRGLVVVADYTGFTMGQFLARTGTDFSQKSIRMWKDAFPARLKQCFTVNEPPFMDMILSLGSKLSTAKMLKRLVRIGTDWEKLHEYIDPEILPLEYGGKLEEVPYPKDWKQTLLNCDKEMEEDGKFGFVDYTIGHETSKHQQDAITKMAGTFKKLDV